MIPSPLRDDGEPRGGAAPRPGADVERLLELQHRLALRLSDVTDLAEGLRLSLDAALEAADMDCGGIYLLDEGTGGFELRCHTGLTPEFVEAVRHVAAGSTQARVVSAGRPVFLPLREMSPAARGAELRENLRVLGVVPFRHEGRVVGFLGAASHGATDAPPAVRTALETIGAQLGGAVARLRSEEELRASAANLRRLSDGLEGRVRERTAELTAALRSLQASEAMYRTLVDTTGTGYLILDEGGRVVDANADYVRLSGHRELGEIRGRSILEWTAPRDRGKNADALARCAAAGRLRVFEVDYVDPAGRVTPVEINATVVEQDGVRRILSLCRDISERRRTEDRLIESQVELMRHEKLAVLGQLVGSLAHELRNPLGVIRNAAYFLGTIVPEGDPRIREYLGIIAAEVASSQRIVSDLLEFSRGRAARAERVLPGPLVAQGLAASAVPDGIEVALDLPEPLPAVEVDPLQLRQVFQNLISNAIEAMPGGGRLTLRARLLAREGAVEVRVEDTGQGIAPEHLSRLFQPLFTTKARGIGLGLTVVKRNVEANRGTISVASEPGRGTAFTVRLPIAADVEEGSP